MTIIISILCLPSTYELIKESIDFIKRNRPDDHRHSTLVRLVMCATASSAAMLVYHPTGAWFWAQYFFFSLCAYAFFDLRMNAIRMKWGGLDHKNVKLLYYGNSWTDGILKRLKPWQDISLRVAVLAAGIIILFIR